MNLLIENPDGLQPAQSAVSPFPCHPAMKPNFSPTNQTTTMITTNNVYTENRETMNGKRVIQRENARTVLNLKSLKFEEKLLCDGVTMNPGDACAFICEFCYVEGQMIKVDKPYLVALNAQRTARGEPELTFEQVVIRRPDATKLLRSQLFRKNGQPKFADPNDNRVV